MLIITARDNKNHRWKRKTKKKKAKTGKNKGVTQATVKVWKLKLLLCV